MNSGNPAIDSDRLRKLLTGELSEEEQAEVLALLEHSPSDRQLLEQLAATPELWKKAAELLKGMPSRSNQEADSCNDAPPVPALSFLRPSSRADCVGELGVYQILEHVGTGGMGIVFKAVDPVLNRVVAVKVLQPTLAIQSVARKRFLREARAAAAVSHDHVVRIYAVEEDQGLPYLVMEFISGTTLQKKIEQDAPLELREILRIGMQIASGLEAAHRQGLVHRDIKPANVLLENGIQRVKITDFGLARSTEVPSLTASSGTISGTPEYMAPEQTTNSNVV
jgi:serine/threonine-protein kinase